MARQQFVEIGAVAFGEPCRLSHIAASYPQQLLEVSASELVPGLAPQSGGGLSLVRRTYAGAASLDLRTFAGQDDIRLCLQLTGDVTPVELQGFSIE